MRGIEGKEGSEMEKGCSCGDGRFHHVMWQHGSQERSGVGVDCTLANTISLITVIRTKRFNFYISKFYVQVVFTLYKGGFIFFIFGLIYLIL